MSQKRARQNNTNADSIRAMTWIPLKDLLPDKSGDYLAVINGETHEAYYDHKSNIWVDPVEEWEDWTKFVTHWMPLPDPPKED